MLIVSSATDWSRDSSGPPVTPVIRGISRISTVVHFAPSCRARTRDTLAVSQRALTNSICLVQRPDPRFHRLAVRNRFPQYKKASVVISPLHVFDVIFLFVAKSMSSTCFDDHSGRFLLSFLEKSLADFSCQNPSRRSPYIISVILWPLRRLTFLMTLVPLR